MTMPSISTETMFMLHEGGTKFYEITLLNAADLGKFLVIRRWGKIGARSTGGEIQIATHATPRAALLDAEKLKNDKTKRGYYIKDATHGFGARFSATGTDDILNAIKRHYVTHWPMVVQHLGMDGDKITGKSADFMVVDEMADIVVEEPAPEPERGENWGSW